MKSTKGEKLMPVDSPDINMEMTFEGRTNGEIEHLMSMYSAYIESWVQEQHPEVMPTHLDVQDFTDQLFDAWGGLPIAGSDVSYTPPEVTLSYIETTPEQATQEVQIYMGRVRDCVRLSRFNASEAWSIFALQARNFVTNPPSGVIGDVEVLARAAAGVVEPINEAVLSVDWLMQSSQPTQTS